MLQDLLFTLNRFGADHFRGAEWDDVENRDQEHRDAYWMCIQAQQAWHGVKLKVEDQVKELRTTIFLLEEESQRERSLKLQRPIAAIEAQLTKSSKQGSAWIRQRLATWQAVDSYAGLHQKNQPDRLWRVCFQLERITHAHQVQAAFEVQDILWKYVHPRGLQWPERVEKSVLVQLEKYFVKLPALPNDQLSTQAERAKIKHFKGAMEIVGRRSFSAEEVTRVLCIMRSRERYDHIWEQIPWLP